MYKIMIIEDDPIIRDEPSLLVSLPILVIFGNSMDPGVISGPGHLFLIIATTLLLFLSIYLVYIVLAYTALRRSVIPEE